MSWSWAIERLNHSLEQLVNWYRDFMQRAEQSFRALHERITYLEDRQAWQGPSDEQVERVLLKIMSERFTDPGIQRVENPNVMKDGDYFVQRAREASIPKPIPMDAASLQVNPDEVPSKAYRQTFEMLENGLRNFPRVDLDKSPEKDDDSEDIKGSSSFTDTKLPDTQHHSKPWS